MDDFWDRRYTGSQFAYGEAPNPFLVAQSALLASGMRALAVADGEGRNGVWLAEQGLEVVSVDRSSVGLAKARALAARRGVRIQTIEADLATWDWPVGEFDLVASIFIHFSPPERERMHGAYRAALKPNGLLILTAFTPRQLVLESGGPERAELLYSAADLSEDFAGMEILELHEVLQPLHEGDYHQGLAATVHLAARNAAPIATAAQASSNVMET